MSEIADFVCFVRKRVLEPKAFQEALESTFPRVGLRQVSRDEAAHLEKEFEHYDQRYPASEFVTDTIGLVSPIERRRLQPTAKSIFDSVEAGNVTVYIPALVFAEILCLSEKQRIDTSPRTVADHMKTYPNYKEYPMSFAVIQSASEITDVPELHDRWIAGTAGSLNLITNNLNVQASGLVNTPW